MMKHLNKIKAALALLFLLPFGGLFAQQTFKYQATLLKVDSDGFYRIMLQPALLAKCTYNASDLRIADPQNKFVSYIFGNQLPVKGQDEFVVFPKSKGSKETDTATIFIAENLGRHTISRLLIKIRDTDVMRFATLSGSDDLKHWYAILDNEILGLLSGNAANKVFKFSPSNYHYFKITISHRHQDPIEILQAGMERSQLVAPTYTQVQIASFTQKDSGKTSLITIHLTEPYIINKLKFDIEGPKYFKRKVLLHEEHNGEKFLSSNLDDLTSSSTPILYLDKQESKLEIEIVNDDNPALKIKSITAYQEEQSMISYLEKGKQYHILFGDRNAIPPDYDIKFFTDSLNRKLPVIEHGAVAPNPLYVAEVSKTKATIPAWAIWLVIVIVLGVLGSLTFRMMREVGKRTAEKKSGE